MKKQNYTSEQRTIAQFQAMELKQRGYQVVALKKEDIFGETQTLAFGYIKTGTLCIKKTVDEDFDTAKESDFTFIYWN